MTKEFLYTLLDTMSVSGHEIELQKKVIAEMTPWCDEIRTDCTGNVISVLNPEAPYKVLLAGHIDEIAGELTGSSHTQDRPGYIAEHLLQLGFKNNLDGFQYILSGLPLFAENPQQTVTKELYPAIAKLHGKSKEQVERSIRNAIDSAWQRRDERIWKLYFSPAPDGTIPRPTNSQLLYTLAIQIYGLQKSRKIG